MNNNFGDDIDRMLEGQADQHFGSGSRGRNRDRGDRRRRSRSRDRDRGRRRERGSRNNPEEMAKMRQERVEKEQERDSRTVFAAQIHPKNEEREIYEFFSEVGKVKDIQLIRDTRTLKSKGLAYIEFEDRRSVPHALALSGRNLNGYPVMVQMTQSDRGYAPAQQTASVMLPQDKPKTLHVRHIHKKLSKDDIIPIFNAFGEVRNVDLIPGKDENEAYVEFRRGAEANTAMVQLNGLEVVGMQISIEQADGERAAGQDGRNGQFADDVGNGGLVMSSQAKQSMMNNLAKRAGLSVPESNPYMGNQPPASNQPVTPCVLLTNMFDPTTETDPDFDLEIREDVQEEVSQHGQLLHIYVDKSSKEGRIYLKFAETSASSKAFQALNGRWFAQNRIVATYMSPQEYSMQFPGV